MTVDGEGVTIDLLDTACRVSKRLNFARVVLNTSLTNCNAFVSLFQHSSSKLKENFLSTGDGFIVIYSITDRKSYITVPRYKEMIEESRDRANQDPVPFLLVGNKTDMEEHRTVAKREGQALANRYEWLFGEASALEYDGVDKSFCDLIREIQTRRRKVSPTDFPSHLMGNLRHSSCSDVDSQTDESASECKKKRTVKKKLGDSSVYYKRKLFGPRH